MHEEAEKNRQAQLRAVISFVAIVLVIIITVIGMIVMKLNKAEAKEEPKPRPIQSVEVVPATVVTHIVQITSQGVVESSRETDLAAEVSGRVKAISPNLKRGGIVKAQETLVEIESADYAAALATAEVTLADSQVALEQEKARTEQAKIDWQKLGRGEPSNPLVLRGPQLAAAEAKVDAAMAEVERARRNLERTKIMAPFAAGVRLAEAEIGAVLNMGKRVATLYSLESLEVSLPLSMEDFGFLNREETAVVKLIGRMGGETYEWQASALRLAPEIDRQSLSAHFVVRLLENKNSPFPLPPVGLFVEAKIEGKKLPNMIEIPRNALLDANRVMLANAENKLEFRDVDVIRVTPQVAILRSGIAAGEKVITTRVSSAIAGIDLIIQSKKEEKK
ncbi:MAG: efflux RND transporter periplasmic adaptor subunit [Verrucomicrobia bacterium]|nr:MAG: efflux RND transporter periplasmic adaptor subunit [Verrucomicrobiota bacterium]